jgi:hypothetical protein
VVQRVAIGLAASGGVLFLAGAAGLTTSWSLVLGTLLLTAASMVAAVALEGRDAPRWTPEPGRPPVEVAPLDPAA